MRHIFGLVTTPLITTRTIGRAKQWVTELRENIDPDAVITLIGNKVDLGEDMRRVSREVARAYAVREGGLPFYETSAVTGANIQEMFNKVGDRAGLLILCPIFHHNR